MNDPKLKLAIARMLPELIWLNTTRDSRGPVHCWKGEKDSLTGQDREILETEWLYVMQWVEQQMAKEEVVSFSMALRSVTGEGCVTDYKMISATFNQRATAMCRVKGIDYATN